MYNTPLDKSNFIKAGLTKECFDASMAEETPGGRAGARGECGGFLTILKVHFASERAISCSASAPQPTYEPHHQIGLVA